MQNDAQENKVSLPHRLHLINYFPGFNQLNLQQKNSLACLFQEVRYAVKENIVKENDPVDSVFLIASGEAEVLVETHQQKKVQLMPVALLHAGEAIGLMDSGFYSSTGKRTGTVTALTDMILLRLNLKDLHEFLQKNHAAYVMTEAANQMLRMQFIKQILPFAKISPERLKWLAAQIQNIHVPENEFIFHEQEKGDCCYLICSGQVEICITKKNAEKKVLALLKPPTLFGEASLISHTPRNATARAVTDCELFVLHRAFLKELLASETDVAHTFVSLMVDRSRPAQSGTVISHKQVTLDGEEITILKNQKNGQYFKLSQEGTYIWEQLNGEHTLQDITLNLSQSHNLFAPDVVAALISKLSKLGFVTNVETGESKKIPPNSSFRQLILMNFKKIFIGHHYAFGDADKWMTKSYQTFVRYLFNQPIQLLLIVFAVVGFATFIFFTPDVLLFFSVKHASFFLLLGLIPLRLIGAILHELGHAYTVKAFDHEVHYIGVGWNWLIPFAFTDTSDMWLASRRERMWVNFAGPYVDLLVAGFASLGMVLLAEMPYLQGMLWLCALYSYVNAFRMLSPLQELDGYYILMDWVEKPKLKKAAIKWLIKKFPQSIRHPQLFKENLTEISYWLSCILYLILLCFLTFILQSFIFNIINLPFYNPYLALLLPLIVMVISCLNILSEIRKQAE